MVVKGDLTNVRRCVRCKLLDTYFTQKFHICRKCGFRRKLEEVKVGE
jgi:ribosomal protein S14